MLYWFTWSLTLERLTFAWLMMMILTMLTLMLVLMLLCLSKFTVLLLLARLCLIFNFSPCLFVCFAFFLFFFFMLSLLARLFSLLGDKVYTLTYGKWWHCFFSKQLLKSKLHELLTVYSLVHATRSITVVLCSDWRLNTQVCLLSYISFFCCYFNVGRVWSKCHFRCYSNHRLKESAKMFQAITYFERKTIRVFSLQ